MRVLLHKCVDIVTIALVTTMFVVTANSFIAFAEDDGHSPKSIATIRINTVGGEEPSCSYVDAPQGCWGADIINNEYIECAVEFYDSHNEQIVDDTGKIRGNTSAYGRKKPYKLKLDSKQDFGNGVSAKKWILLRSGTDLNYIFANWVSQYCGIEWQPSFQYVNLYMNDDYKGCYVLTEAVENMEKRLKMDSDGFLIENDPYWWNSDVFFKVSGQIYPLGFTFKYPDGDDIKDDYEYLGSIRNTIEEVTSSIKRSDEKSLELIDVESFAAWYLVNDYLCNSDAGGSNMYWYRTSRNEKIKLGPTWDYDSNYMGNPKEWASIHTESFNYGSDLFSKAEFRKAYRMLFEQKKRIHSELSEYVNGYISIYGESIQASWDLDADRWGTDAGSVEGQKESYLKWYEDRTEWIDNATSGDWILPEIKVMSSGFNGIYDGQPHGITVEVSEPENGATVRYGTSEGVYTFDESPTITNPSDSPFTVFYRITAEGYHTKSGREVVCITNNEDSKPKEYNEENPGKRTIVDLTGVKGFAINRGKGSFKAKWRKLKKKDQKKIDGYEIQYSRDGSFLDVATKRVKASRASVKIKKLGRRKRYYVRIRSYKDDGSVYHVSKWKKKKVRVR